MEKSQTEADNQPPHQVHLPPLRSRGADILLLANDFLEQFAEGSNKRVTSIAEPAAQKLLTYSWPGNVRELQNAVQFAFVKCSDNTLDADDLPIELREGENACVRRGPAKKLNSEGVRAAIIRTGGNKAKAAKFLGACRPVWL